MTSRGPIPPTAATCAPGGTVVPLRRNARIPTLAPSPTLVPAQITEWAPIRQSRPMLIGPKKTSVPPAMCGEMTASPADNRAVADAHQVRVEDRRTHDPDIPADPAARQAEIHRGEVPARERRAGRGAPPSTAHRSSPSRAPRPPRTGLCRPGRTPGDSRRMSRPVSRRPQKKNRYRRSSGQETEKEGVTGGRPPQEGADPPGNDKGGRKCTCAHDSPAQCIDDSRERNRNKSRQVNPRRRVHQVGVLAGADELPCRQQAAGRLDVLAARLADGREDARGRGAATGELLHLLRAARGERSAGDGMERR